MYLVFDWANHMTVQRSSTTPNPTRITPRSAAVGRQTPGEGSRIGESSTDGSPVLSSESGLWKVHSRIHSIPIIPCFQATKPILKVTHARVTTAVKVCFFLGHELSLILSWSWSIFDIFYCRRSPPTGLPQSRLWVCPPALPSLLQLWWRYLNVSSMVMSYVIDLWYFLL